MRRIAIIVILVISLAFVGCSYTPDTSDSYVNVDGSETTPYDIDTSEAQSIDVSESSETVEINNGGTYFITGSTDDNMIIVNVSDSEEVNLILENVNITSETSAPVYVKSAGSVTISLAGSNTLSNAGVFAVIGEDEIDAVIFCESNLTITGDGTLDIVSPQGHGIVCKDNLFIENGTFNITAGIDGINANDTLSIVANNKGSITAFKSDEDIIFTCKFQLS